MSNPQESIYNEVFVSYSRKNKAFAKKIVQAIYDSGRENIWIDWEDIEYAEDWWQKIQAGIESAHNFIFILTPDSVQSDVCYKEVEHAVQSGKRIIPVEHIPITDKADFEKMHPTISSHNWLPFKENDDFDASMKQVIQTIEKDIAHTRFHTRLQTRAREWVQFERDAAYLLSGGELAAAQTWLSNAELEAKSPSVTNLQKQYIETSQTAETQFHAEQAKIAGQVKNFRRASIGLGIVSLIAIIASVFLSFRVTDIQYAIETQAYWGEIVLILSETPAYIPDTTSLQPLQLGENTGEWRADYNTSWSYEGEGGSRVNLILSSSEFQPMLYILDSNLNYLLQTDYAEDGAIIVPDFDLPEDGQIIVLTNGLGYGSYTLEIEEVDADWATATESP